MSNLAINPTHHVVIHNHKETYNPKLLIKSKGLEACIWHSSF